MKNLIKIIGLLIFVVLINSCKKNANNNEFDLFDINGNGYHTVIIGTQTWMLENLITSKFNDNTAIPMVNVNSAWSNLTTPGFCWPDTNPPTSKVFSGALYNWYTIETQKLCPIGWHVPTRADYKTLEQYLGGVTVAGGKMKETGTAHWKDPNTGATNESGFTALPGTGRSMDGTIYSVSGYTCTFWTSSTIAESAYYFGLDYSTSNTTSDVATNKKAGHLVRCMKD